MFILSIRREWGGIDYLRLDKFYLLIRRFVYHLFVLFKKNSWDVVLVREMVCVLEEKSMLSVDKFPAQGVNYHLVEVFWDELKGFFPIKLEVVEIMLNPFLSVLGKSVDKVLLNKIKSSLFGRLLENGRKLLERRKAREETGVDEVELFGAIALKLGFAKKFFELGSSMECVQGNRKVLFGLREDFVKLEKDLANSKIEIEIPDVGYGDAEEEDVPQLVHISLLENGAAEQISDGSSDKALKKKKKKDKKAKKESGENGSKKLKKKKDLSADSAPLEEDNGNMSNGGKITFNETVISNLQMQFERVAAEVGMDMDRTASFDSPEKTFSHKVPKKRKRAKSIDGHVPQNDGGSVVGKSGERNAKKVRFSMKNNLVWKPQSPLPPQSLRLPPSATPRGSALKKGIPAGPVIETPMLKKVKRRNSPLKKVRKGLKSISPSVKRLKKLRAQSA